MTELKLEVGKTYNLRRGGTAEIIKDHATYIPFLANNGDWYSTNGGAASGLAGDDLISEHIEPAQPARSEAVLIEDMCARIEAADHLSMKDDYMLSSDDCIKVLRGTWSKDQTVAPAQPAARTPRPHAQLRKDFADGWDIEFFSLTYSKWVMCNSEPGWHPDVQFRRKPEPLKPNSTVFLGILDNGFGSYAYETGRELKNTGCLKAIRIEFNPNTQELVSAEVVTL